MCIISGVNGVKQRGCSVFESNRERHVACARETERNDSEMAVREISASALASNQRRNEK